MGKSLIIKSADFSINAISEGLPAPVITFSQSGGSTFATITKSSDGTIHYTTNGQTPTAESPIYSTPFAVEEGTTIKAIEIVDGEESSIAERTYWGLRIYGSTEVYTSTGDSSTDAANPPLGVTAYPFPYAKADGQLVAMKMSYTVNKAGKIRIGSIDQNNKFIERISYNVTLNANSVETDLTQYNITVKENEVVLFMADTPGNGKYTLTNDSSKWTITADNETDTLRQRTDTVAATFYYKIQH